MWKKLCTIGVLVLALVSDASASDDNVLVEIFELSGEQTWPAEVDLPTESFEVGVMALPILPRRYSAEAVIVDRNPRFVVRLSMERHLPAGDYELLLRAMNRARLLVDGRVVGETAFKVATNDGHNEVPDVEQLMPDLRVLPPGHDEEVVQFQSTGRPAHRFAFEVVVGGKKKRPETGELSVSIRRAGSEQLFAVLSSTDEGLLELNDAQWEPFVAAEHTRIAQMNRQRRYLADERKEYWAQRHSRARDHVESLEPLELPAGSGQPIDRIIAAVLDTELPPEVDDYRFLRRLALDTVGVIPTVDELELFLAEPAENRRAAAITRYLADDRWADHWVSYWQDVLAENPGILKPKLNNTGPFRWWIHESFVDNKPMDRFVTELIMMRGSKYSGGPAGFSMATQNDVPMAAKAHVLGQAFLGIQMRCARCHDAPQHDLRQEELFSLAAMLDRSPLEVPASSSIPASEPEFDSLAVQVTLKPGSVVSPVWPFGGVEGLQANLPPGLIEDPEDSRERLAAIVTSYTNQRFAQVLANRLWHRLIGRGIVDVVDDWEHATNHAPLLLDFLARELIANNYDLKHVAGLILKSRTYQAEIASGSEAILLPARRRLSAEQVVDSLFTVSGKSFKSEALNLDVDGQRSIDTFLNLGVPRRAWEFTSLSNERDRPALAMPHAQSVVDMLLTFGWRDSRQDPLTDRDSEPTVQQPGILANSVLVQRTTCLSDDNELTSLCHSAASPHEVLAGLFARILTRPPSTAERDQMTQLIADGFAGRVTHAQRRKVDRRKHTVSWSNHLNAEATRIKLEIERQARKGDPPTETLSADWRDRVEDIAWALVNSPEFVFSP